MTDIWFGTSGPRNARVIIVGEAWGREEAQARLPFVGQSGRELFRMLYEALDIHRPLLAEALAARSQHQWLSLRDAWLQRAGILLANVVAAQPPGNDYTHFLYDNQEARTERAADYHGIYPRPQLSNGIRNLHRLIDTVRPDIVVAAGNWPLHILTEHSTPKTSRGFKLPTGIATWRGSQTYSRSDRAGGPATNHECTGRSSGSPEPHRDQALLAPIPVLPIIHPAAILREWGYRHVTVHDLRSRLGRFLNGQLAWAPPSTNDISRPTLEDVRTALGSWRQHLSGSPLWLSVDIETYAKRFITCVGLCDGELALCIPMFYFDDSQRAVNYWQLEDEQWIWSTLRELLEHPNIRIIGQNFIYDTQYFARDYHITAIISGDTMVAHHLLYPGTPKGLEVLASLYNHHYIYWKDESEEWAADSVSAEDLWKYNCIDTRRTFEAWFNLWKVIQHEGMEDLYADRMDQWQLAREMTLRGVARDAQLQEKMVRDLYWQLNPVETWLLGAVPEAWRYTQARKPWFTSSQATAQVLYTACGITPVLHKKTKQPTTDDTAILELCERDDTKWLAPLLTRLRDYRSAQVFLRNFLLSRPTPDGRWATQVNVAHPETFRWSSGKNAFDEGSNMQNLPKVED